MVIGTAFVCEVGEGGVSVSVPHMVFCERRQWIWFLSCGIRFGDERTMLDELAQNFGMANLLLFRNVLFSLLGVNFQQLPG